MGSGLLAPPEDFGGSPSFSCGAAAAVCRFWLGGEEERAWDVAMDGVEAAFCGLERA